MFGWNARASLCVWACILGLVALAGEWASAAGMGGGGMGGGGMGGGGCCGGGNTVINPPVSGPFRDPVIMPNESTTKGIVEVTVEAKVAPININGTTAQLMTYNGYYPAPTIKIKQDDTTLRIHLKNHLPETGEKNMLGYLKNLTNLHTHGFHVHANMPMSEDEPLSDYLMYEIGPNQTKEHEYDLKLHPRGTMSFYHPHKHGLVAEQYWGGMLGTILVDDPNTLLAPYEMHQVILKDIALSGNAPAPYTMMNEYMMGKEGNIIMVNGQVNPGLKIKKGQIQRWRILNASNARFYKLSLEGHPLNVIGTDGGLLDKPYAFPDILLAPGERVDVLVQANQIAKSYRLLAIPYSRMGMGGMGGSMGGSQTITLMTMIYDQTMSPAQTVPKVINSNAKRLSTSGLKIVANRTLVLSMGMGRGYINGQDFDVDPYEIMSNVDTYEIWTVNNASNMDHPFHQHINSAQVLSISGGDINYTTLCTKTPAMKDVVIIPKMGSAKLLVPVKDYTGHAMFHCHILEHEDIGMMGMWEIMDMPMSK